MKIPAFFPVLVMGLSSLFVSQQAMAHAHLKTAVPADKAELTESPKQLALSFTESLEPSFSKAELKNADGHIIPAGKPALDPKDKATLIVPVSTKLDKGQYEVDWTALSVDGHKTQGKYTFTVK
ncbi:MULTISPECIES: copper homeostasis periplasmic binding protein CopC [Enterobacter cloacae complex]|uniref:copper homeostasis periplasmic binding protein CopC n=1 Tax=Enterobacter cloacae complex TaxID=354276 RepID=UPI002003480F|nr:MULTISPECIES: copper homeostasis periplasmic binding protein CopC [Enterobacter cloacae complex]MCK7301417.1 copper homeostasis periplasmic binding protein CopC [Enterobacter asburiae]